MQAAEYEKGLLVAAAWRLAFSNDVNELVAVACVVRNWVVKRPFLSSVLEPLNGQRYYPGYSGAVAAFLTVYPTRLLPVGNEPALIDPAEGLLARVDGVYDCSLPDVTSSRAFPAGARYFGRAATTRADAWFAREVLARQDVHPLVGTFGSQQFYA